jgi:hypothetical protein
MATTMMKMPITPVTTLPLSRHITHSTRLTVRMATDDHHAAVPIRPVTKSTPPISAPMITRTQKIASTDLRPCSAQ